MKKTILIAVCIALAGCSGIRGNVIPLADGLYQVETVGYTTQKATSKALETATTVCEKRGLRPVVKDQSDSYHGTYPEAVRDQFNEQNKAMSMFLTKPLPSFNRPDDYRVAMRFTCER